MALNDNYRANKMKIIVTNSKRQKQLRTTTASGNTMRDMIVRLKSEKQHIDENKLRVESRNKNINKTVLAQDDVERIISN